MKSSSYALGMVGMRLASFSLIALLMSSCASLDQQASDCGAPAGWEAIAERGEGGFVVFGELHGTEEMPRAFASYVCEVAKWPGRTMVGLEIEDMHQDAFDAARLSDDPRSALLAGDMADFWSRRDGRSSEAMLDLLVTLMAYDNVDVVFFNGLDPFTDFGIPEGTSNQEIGRIISSMSMAERQLGLEKYKARVLVREAHRSDRQVVLTGELHAQKIPTRFLPGVETMPMLMDAKIVSLAFRRDGGTAWYMTSGNGSAKEVRGVRRQGVPDNAAAPSMGLFPEETDGFDGYIYVGPLTASPPAIREAE